MTDYSAVEITLSLSITAAIVAITVDQGERKCFCILIHWLSLRKGHKPLTFILSTRTAPTPRKNVSQ